MTEEFLQNFLREMKDFYCSIGTVGCPYFGGEAIHFTSSGYKHLLFRRQNDARTVVDLESRLRLLPCAIHVVKKSGTLQEYRRVTTVIRQKIRGAWRKSRQEVHYYSFVSIVHGIRIKIVIKEIGDGAKNFHSVFPCNVRGALSTGDVEED